eukprot:1159656-Pelagomonas_calceolata.AAC.17
MDIAYFHGKSHDEGSTSVAVHRGSLALCAEAQINNSKAARVHVCACALARILVCSQEHSYWASHVQLTSLLCATAAPYQECAIRKEWTPMRLLQK